MKILLSQIFITGTVITDNILEPPCSVFTNVFTSEHELWDLEQRWERNYVNHGSWEMWSLWHGSPEEIISGIHLFRRFKIHQTQSSPPPLWTVLCQEKLRWTRVWLASLTLSSASVSASSDAVSATLQRNFGEVIYALETCTWSLWNVK